MNFCKNTDGFSLKKDNIGFDFKTAQIPTEKDGFFCTYGKRKRSRTRNIRLRQTSFAC